MLIVTRVEAQGIRLPGRSPSHFKCTRGICVNKTVHAGIGASQYSRVREVNATKFEFISENTQIAAACESMRLLPKTLNVLK